MNFENVIFSSMHLHYVDKIKSYVCTQCGYFQSFSVTQILREIKVGESEVSKLSFYIYLEALNFDFYEFLHFDQK